jgi:hypothetical protein
MVGRHGFSFAVNSELTDDKYLAIVATTPDGKILELWAEVELTGRTAILRQFAIYGANVGPRQPRSGHAQTHGPRSNGGIRCRCYPN